MWESKSVTKLRRIRDFLSSNWSKWEWAHENRFLFFSLPHPLLCFDGATVSINLVTMGRVRLTDTESLRGKKPAWVNLAAVLFPPSGSGQLLLNWESQSFRDKSLGQNISQTWIFDLMMIGRGDVTKFCNRHIYFLQWSPAPNSIPSSVPRLQLPTVSSNPNLSSLKLKCPQPLYWLPGGG